MSLDLSQFYQVFFEETAEHLATMESLLLDLDVSNPSMEDLNAIFRSAHSIKGGSGTFGFTDMTEVTHVLETLLDRLRKQEMTLTDEMVNAFLRAGDVLAMQLAAHRGDGEVDQTEVRSVCEELNVLASGSGAHGAADTSSPEIAPQSGDDYGFFDDVPAPAVTDPGYGLFDEVKPAAVDPGYGFFDTEPEVKVADPGYGFFDSVEPPKLDGPGYGFFEQPSEITEVKVIDAGEGFGFFEDAPGVVNELENQRGYGFFRETPLQRSDRENRQGYGIYEEHEEALSAKLPEPAANKPDETTAKAEGKPQESQSADASRAKRTTERAAAPAAHADTSIRVSVEKVDQLINLMGELVITQAMLAQAATHTDGTMQERLDHGLRQLERNTRDLQEAVMSIACSQYLLFSAGSRAWCAIWRPSLASRSNCAPWVKVPNWTRD